MSPTIKDVAERAGVSLSTVSFVLNKKKNISKETIKKVQAAIDELNYHPRHLARGLASQKSGNIGFILTDDHFSRAEPFYTKIFLGSEFEARNHNYYILLTTVGKSFSKNSIPRFLLEKNVDGVILAGKIPLGLIDYIQSHNLPMIFVDYLPQKGKASAVLIDNVDGAHQAVTHLIEKGHTDVAFICGDCTHPSMQERYIGYEQALVAANLKVNENLIITEEPNTSDIDGYNAIRKLLQKNEHCTAIFAANDAMAFGCMRFLKENKIHVPKDIALVGFDDVEIAKQMEPHLTTLRVCKEDMGAIAVKNMVEMILGSGRTIGKILVPVELVIRETT